MWIRVVDFVAVLGGVVDLFFQETALFCATGGLNGPLLALLVIHSEDFAMIQWSRSLAWVMFIRFVNFVAVFGCVVDLIFQETTLFCARSWAPEWTTLGTSSHPF